ncbi:MAG: hypothetical protein E4H14_16455 [Candidatus Thorarchaeota archaeon]|nr:MAG: hypothetical protein E4H14_16455 [Candidatus Thorarchaeota archaeon]
MSSSDPYAEKQSNSRRQRVWQYYSNMMEPVSRPKDKNPISWEKTGASMKGMFSRIGHDLDVPFKSFGMFAGCWMLLEIGWPLLVMWGVASAGSVWNIPTAIPFAFIVTYGLVLVSGTNVIRSLVTQLAGKRDNIVKALFRGYFWGLLSVGLVFMIHGYFHTHSPLLFWIPIFYILPIDTMVGTVPVPIPLGITGLYMDLVVTIIVYVVGIIGSCIGGIELLQYFMNNSSQHGSYGSILSVLLLTVFPVMNIHFSSVFLTAILELFWRMI